MPIPSPAASLGRWLFQSNFFCGCIPVRAGFVLASTLTLLLSGAIAVIIWFEISHSHQPSTKERVTLILAGVAESLLFVASALGFIGAVARKQLFVVVYAYFLYVHFALNLVIGVYLLVVVRKSNRPRVVDYCSEIFVNTSTESSCSRLLTVPTYVFVVIIAALLWLELYGTLIVTRYVYRLHAQKRDDRSRRLGYFHAMAKPQASGHSRQASDHIELLRPQERAYDLGDVVLDIRPQSYMPVSTEDHDLPLVPAPRPLPSPPNPLPDAATGRRVRALPPRPVAPPGGADTAGQPPTSEFGKERRRRGSGSEDGRDSLYTAVSTDNHAALMDHAGYMETMFSSAAPVPPLPREAR